MKRIVWFFSNFIDGRTDEVSSRRGVALTALVLVVGLATAHICGRDIDPEIYIATVMLVAAALGFTLKSVKKDERN